MRTLYMHSHATFHYSKDNKLLYCTVLHCTVRTWLLSRGVVMSNIKEGEDEEEEEEEGLTFGECSLLLS